MPRTQIRARNELIRFPALSDPSSTLSEIPHDSYCHAARGHHTHGPYHDSEHGFSVPTDVGLFERLLLEINQAGLSWLAILRKREGLRAAYDDYAIERIACYGEADRERLLSDPRAVRNRLKVDAAISNARTVLLLRRDFGSFSGWLDAHHPRSRNDWVTLFRATFRFTGGAITPAFLVSVGYLPGAHHPACPIYEKALASEPRWVRG